MSVRCRKVEHCDSIEQFHELVHTLGKRLNYARYDELRRSFLNWLKTALWPRYIEDIDIGHIHSLKELDTMLIEERPTFTEQWRRKGREEGRAEGEAKLLKRQLARRFGALSEETVARIDCADSAELETWSLNILDAQTLDDVFKNG